MPAQTLPERGSLRPSSGRKQSKGLSLRHADTDILSPTGNSLPHGNPALRTSQTLPITRMKRAPTADEHTLLRLQLLRESSKLEEEETARKAAEEAARREAAEREAADKLFKAEAKAKQRDAAEVLSEVDPLVHAAKRGDWFKIEQLVVEHAGEDETKQAAYVNQIDRTGASPLLLATWPGHEHAIKVVV